MNVDIYENILQGTLNLTTLRYLDLSNNNLSEEFILMICRIIQRQGQRRDQTLWSYQLRNESPKNNDYTNGLISLNLEGNKFGKKAAEQICNSL